MAKFRLVTDIAAPIDVCFDLARDIDFHARSLEGMRHAGRLGRCDRKQVDRRHEPAFRLQLCRLLRNSWPSINSGRPG